MDKLHQNKYARTLTVFWLLAKIALIVILGSTEGVVPVYQGF